MIDRRAELAPERRDALGARPLLRRSLQDVSAVGRRGGVVGYAVAACFGLGCDPRNRRAVRRLLRLKRWPAAKGLILIARQAEALRPSLTELPAQVPASGPSPYAWLVEARPALPPIVRGRQKPARHYRDLCRRFGRDRDAILLGRRGTRARPTSIRDARSGHTIRS